jgi:hypothetical protein
MCAIFVENAMPFLENQTLMHSCYLYVSCSVAASSFTVVICKSTPALVLKLMVTLWLKAFLVTRVAQSV